MIPASDLFDQSTMAALLEHDPVVQDYRAFFALLDWSVVEHWQHQRSPRGRPAHPESAYLKAFVVRIREGLLYTSQLRRFLLQHPLLVIELGFHLHLVPSAAYGFDVQQTLPCEQRLRQKLRTFDPTLLQDVLAATVAALQEAIPGLGETIAFDVKHIYAWVRENNPRVYVTGPFNVHYIPKGVERFVCNVSPTETLEIIGVYTGAGSIGETGYVYTGEVTDADKAQQKG